MDSAPTHCPECGRPKIVGLADLLHSPRVDFFRCGKCLCWWMVPKGKERQPHALSSATPTGAGEGRDRLSPRLHYDAPVARRLIAMGLAREQRAAEHETEQSRSGMRVDPGPRCRSSRFTCRQRPRAMSRSILSGRRSCGCSRLSWPSMWRKEGTFSGARAKGWRVTSEHTYSDDAISGAETRKLVNRQRLLDAIASGTPPFPVLIMRDASSFSRRDGEEAFAELKRIAQAGIEIWFYEDGSRFTFGSFGANVVRFVRAEMNAEYRRQIARFTKEAMVRKAHAGHVTGGSVFGYLRALCRGHGLHLHREAPQHGGRAHTMPATGSAFCLEPVLGLRSAPSVALSR
jgi:DNA invertase Pin-like site-specific DNA recombinase